MDLKMLRMAVSRLQEVLDPALKELDAWRQSVVPQILRGILVSGTTVLTQITRRGRAPGHSFAAARKSFENHLTSPAWDAEEDRAVRAVECWVGSQVKPLTPIWVDNTEIAKPHACEMEGLSRVRDADQSSRRGQTVTEPGYWKLDAYAEIWSPGDPVPLAQLVYGIGERGCGHFASENQARAHLYDRLQAATGGNGVIIQDRGFDGDVNYQLLRARGLHFLIRQVGERWLQNPRGETLGSLHGVARTLPLEAEAVLKFDRRGRREKWDVQFGWAPVRLPHVPGPLWLIAVRHRRARMAEDQWLYLLTTVEVHSAGMAERLIRAYVRRWKVEEAIRFLKSDLGLEQVRALCFRALRRLVQMTYWAALVVACMLRDVAEGTVRRMGALAEALPKQAKFLYYRTRRALAKLLDPHLALNPSPAG